MLFWLPFSAFVLQWGQTFACSCCVSAAGTDSAAAFCGVDAAGVWDEACVLGGTGGAAGGI